MNNYDSFLRAVVGRRESRKLRRGCITLFSSIGNLRLFHCGSRLISCVINLRILPQSRAAAFGGGSALYMVMLTARCVHDCSKMVEIVG
jgi:hypothetical protein